MKKPRSGWFVEIPTELKVEFKAYYPDRAMMKRVTVAAINQAIKWAKENNLPRRDKDDRQGEMF